MGNPKPYSLGITVNTREFTLPLDKKGETFRGMPLTNCLLAVYRRDTRDTKTLRGSAGLNEPELKQGYKPLHFLAIPYSLCKGEEI